MSYWNLRKMGREKYQPGFLSVDTAPRALRHLITLEV